MAEDKTQVEAKSSEKKTGRKRNVEPVETSTKVGYDPALKVKPGDDVFLTYLAGPDIEIGDVMVNSTNREAVVPENIGPNDLLRIDKQVRMGHLTVGKLPEAARSHQKKSYLEKDPSVLTYCERMLEHPADTRELCSGLSRAGAHLSGWAPKDLVKELIRIENKNLSRPNILNLLHTALNSARLISFRSVPFDPKLHATSDVVQKIDSIRTRA